MHERLDEIQFGLDTSTDSRVTCPCASEKSMYNVVNTPAPSFLIGSSSSILADKEDNHNISDEFEFQLDSTKDCGVSCP